ncbi:helix-turn-helix domain-containing protein [Ruficoccus amylovorans]|uniref:Helix-turn-helix domain-containing protein n=1 Tax=Ruficoccus amylovorans TaxID=1804625 RepID=A0A842HB85_9BACT|nr:helix-turn-helix domain-containing protein [Ruficoccus amylovorans]MBC2592834.1 helix-turn-helix domain-containing protein [Ruficoccus amylovorans]
MNDTTITVNEAAAMLGISRRSLYRLIADGLLPRTIRERGRARLLLSDMKAYIERLRKGRR